MKSKLNRYLMIAFATIQVAYGFNQAAAQKLGSADLKNFPKGEGPVEIGQKIAAHFVATPHTNFGRPVPPKYITYPETCTWYGALTFAKETKNANLLHQLAERLEPLFGSQDTLIPKPDHVDYSVFGSVPLELYMQTKEQKYLDLGKRIADKQWGIPEGPRVNAEARRFYAKGT